MTWESNPVWSEGMFLRPQHFQQYERHVQRLVRTRVADLSPYPWGLTELEINRELLLAGKFAITRCAGVLADGTPIDLPGLTPPPVPLELAQGVVDQLVYLALPLRQPGTIEVEINNPNSSSARYGTGEYQAIDSTTGTDGIAPIQIAVPRFRFMLDRDDRAGYTCIGLARIVEVRADGQVVLDKGYIPPALIASSSPVLLAFVTEIHGLLGHRAEALAARVAHSGTRGVAEIADFMMLQAVNRYLPLFGHLQAAGIMHPERVFSLMLEAAGELATFTQPGKRPPAFPPYLHEDLEATFAAVMAELRQSLSAVLEQTAIAIPLQERRYGIRVGQIADRSLLKTARFVLAVKADIQAEGLRRDFPLQCKIGPVETIRELVNVALPGIKITLLPVTPRQIPYHAGFAYFELDRTGQYWAQLATSGGFAIHVAGEFPNLAMEFWAIRE